MLLSLTEEIRLSKSRIVELISIIALLTLFATLLLTISPIYPEEDDGGDSGGDDGGGDSDDGDSDDGGGEEESSDDDSSDESEDSSEESEQSSDNNEENYETEENMDRSYEYEGENEATETEEERQFEEAEFRAEEEDDQAYEESKDDDKPKPYEGVSDFELDDEIAHLEDDLYDAKTDEEKNRIQGILDEARAIKDTRVAEEEKPIDIQLNSPKVIYKDGEKKYCVGKGEWKNGKCNIKDDEDRADYEDAVCDNPNSKSKICDNNGKKKHDKDRDHHHDGNTKVIKKYYYRDDDDDNDDDDNIDEEFAYSMGYRNGIFDKQNHLPFNTQISFDDKDNRKWYALGYTSGWGSVTNQQLPDSQLQIN